MSTRDVVLARIRGALRGGAAPGPDALAEAEAHVARHQRGPLPAYGWEPLARFRERAQDLSSTVDEVAAVDQVPGAVASYINGNRLPKQGICWPAFGGLDWSAHGLTMEARPATGSDLVGVTGAFCAIADTATLLLLSGIDTPAAASLLPETHIAVVPVSRIVKCMEDAWDLLRRERGRLPRAVNFVSGPSRTADIEQTVTLGAHGPYRVHIILVKAEG